MILYFVAKLLIWRHKRVRARPVVLRTAPAGPKLGWCGACGSTDWACPHCGGGMV